MANKWGDSFWNAREREFEKELDRKAAENRKATREIEDTLSCKSEEELRRFYDKTEKLK